MTKLGSMKDIHTGLALIFVILFAAAGLVVLFGGSFERKQNPLELEFRAACSQLNGKTVWSGKQWECLK